MSDVFPPEQPISQDRLNEIRELTERCRIYNPAIWVNETDLLKLIDWYIGRLQFTEEEAESGIQSLCAQNAELRAALKNLCAEYASLGTCGEAAYFHAEQLLDRTEPGQ